MDDDFETGLLTGLHTLDSLALVPSRPPAARQANRRSSGATDNAAADSSAAPDPDAASSVKEPLCAPDADRPGPAPSSPSSVPRSLQKLKLGFQRLKLRFQRWRRRHKLQGWRFGVACSACLAVSVLVANSVLLLLMYTKYRHTLQSGIGTFYTGSCSTVNTGAVVFHVAINVLSTLLLSASNYTMQCLASPTRREVDRAHANGDWLDIGVVSMRNIDGFNISFRRKVLWSLLALSSLAVHLLYNSVISKTLQANNYSLSLVKPEFVNQTTFLYLGGPCADDSMWGDTVFCNDYGTVQHIQTEFQEPGLEITKMSNAECIGAYGRQIVTDRADVLLVTSTSDPSHPNNTVVFSVLVYALISPNMYDWICSDEVEGPFWPSLSPCDIKSVQENASNWTVYGYKIDYCLSIAAVQQCRLHFAVYLLVAVIACNAVKSAAMVLSLAERRDPGLITTGDAIESFLGRPEKRTKCHCMAEKRNLYRSHAYRLLKPSPPVKYHGPIRRRWFCAASKFRWVVTQSLGVASVTTASVFLGQHQGGVGDSALFRLPFGSVAMQTMVNENPPENGSGGLIAASLLANLPQLFLSLLSLTYTRLFANMLQASEWDGYFLRRRSLRVTNPQGQQQSTYWLHLPAKYGLPLLIAFALLHWLASESFFLVDIFAYDSVTAASTPYFGNLSMNGFSAVPILLSIILVSCMLLVPVAMGFRKFSSPMPLAGSCSILIAAACHPPEHDENAAQLPVSWGDVVPENAGEIGHCTFTSGKVHDLVVGRAYA